ncbi:MAG TPA: hypothetical protein VFA60_04105 [Terriglobales bacterium]|nr:hypothetical protein [Terriglobales bacterium]
MKRTVICVAAILALFSFATAADKPQTLTGVITDEMCGARHMMSGSAADCVRACVKEGSKYGLVVGDTVYTLDGGDQAAIDKLAGERAKITGSVNGKTVKVQSVSAAK